MCGAAYQIGGWNADPWCTVLDVARLIIVLVNVMKLRGQGTRSVVIKLWRRKLSSIQGNRHTWMERICI